MPASTSPAGSTVWDLPPLILHPFNERVPPSALLENSKAALVLSGLIANDGSDPEELRRRLLAGRYSEIRMLFFLGKDVLRWIEQCLEWAQRTPELEGIDLERQSFAALLTGNPPERVKLKLVAWGVGDYSSIFSRAIGLNAMFAEPPAFQTLGDEFLRHYHMYADALYRCFIDAGTHRPVPANRFRFELYASGEYSKMLESEWGTE